jgi:hypothetical protein
MDGFSYFVFDPIFPFLLQNTRLAREQVDGHIVCLLQNEIYFFSIQRFCI